MGTLKNGLRRRILQHLSSNTDNTVFARHLAADKTSPWCVGLDLENRDVRKHFLATACCYQVLPLPDLTEAEIDDLEDFVELRLKPRYIDYVRA